MAVVVVVVVVVVFVVVLVVVYQYILHQIVEYIVDNGQCRLEQELDLFQISLMAYPDL